VGVNSSLISVIIPTYNRMHIIKDAIETVLNQSYQNFEIVIVDDGSTDNTQEVVKNFNDSRIKYIYQSNSGKPSIARNTGIKQASGNFIAFLDSDDFWHPQMLERHINAFNNNPNVGFTINWNSYVSFEGNELYQKACLANNQIEYIRYILLNPDYTYPGPSGSLVKKECFDKVGIFDEELDFCEDWDLFFRLAVCYEMYNIKETLTYVRVHKKSFTRNNQDNFPKFKNSYLTFLQKAFENKNLPLDMLSIKNEVYSNVYNCFGGMILYDRKNPNGSREDYLKSLSYLHGRMFNIKFLIALSLAFLPHIFLKTYMRIKKIYKKVLGKNY